ncbi:outer membrane efflux protein [Desulfurobacterium thermolithotrophum DSM 11699]|uniref:Outer membrane efflux protein n=1 Tax=Desulfurobacterium thermolithotrophum (strain DSM 11699 / BSA) TaxID=868864 RepID=F0S295_DESTD|nr:TolC family protein [Desulfurobacterium thermolithotrophum]ADY74110.1 outer membrane efflux protein [Desulfurobacterium thermolithotrophum DSM 11699]
MGGLLIFFIFLPLSVYAITLQEAENLAIKNYPKLKAIELQAKSLEKKSKSLKLLRLGEVDVIAGFTHYNRNNILVPMSHMPSPLNSLPFDSQKFSYGISYSVPLYLGGNISRKVEIAKLQAEILKNLETATQWQIKYNVDALYLNYLSLSETEKALKSYRESLLKLQENVKAGIKVGKFAKVDLLKVEYSVEDVQSKIDEIKAKKSAIITALETLVGKKIKKIEPVIINYQEKEYLLKNLYLRVLERNHLIKAKEKEVKVSLKEVNTEKGKYGIKVKLDAFYTRNYGFDSKENEGFGTISLNFQLPIFEFGRKKNDILSAKLRKISKEKEYETSKLELKKELANVIADLSSIQSKIRTLKKKLELAKEVERIEKLKYESGKGDVDHLLLAKSKRFLTEAELRASYYRWESDRRRIKALMEEE